LYVDATQRRRIDPISLFLGANIAHEVRRTVGVTVDVAIETSYAEARPIGPTVVRGVELLLREGRQQ
jgi:hypothetical protein